MARALTLTATALAVLLLFAQVAVATDDVGNEAAAAQEHAQRAVSAVFDPTVHHTLGRHVARGFTAQQASVRSVAVNASCTSSAMHGSSYMAAVNASCGADVRASLELFFMFNVSTPAARAAVDTMCSASCQAAYKAFVDAYAPCGNDGAARGLKAVTTMCQRWGGDYCANKMRVVADTGACSSLNAAQCQSSNVFCQWNGQSCVQSLSQAALEQLCTPCYEAAVSVIPDMQAANVGDVSTAPAGYPEAVAALRAALALACGKVGNTFCYPIFRAVPMDLSFGMMARVNAMPMAEVEGNVTATCTPTGAACIRKANTASLLSSELRGRMAVRECLREGRFTAATCYAHLRSLQLPAQMVAARYAALCAKGAGPSQNDWCMPAIHRWSRNACRYTCNTTCVAQTVALANDMGCCANYLARATEGRLLPSEVDPQFRAGVTFSYAELHNTSHNVTFNSLNYCGAFASVHNASAAAAATAAGRAACPRAPAVSRELPLRGLRWSAISGNATRRAALTAALRTDVALAAGVLVDDVVDATLAEDASQALTVASRRQAVAGTKFTFGIRADTTAAASLAASEFDTAATNGNLRVDSAAAVLADGCTGCVGSPTAAPGATAAPPATGDFGAALSGASPSGTVSDSATVGAAFSAAFAVSIAIAVFV